MEIEIPAWLTVELLLYVAETERTVEEVVKDAIKSYMERNDARVPYSIYSEISQKNSVWESEK